jgi:hypothetical protein
MLLTISLVGVAFLLGLFMGAGLHESGARAERLQTDRALANTEDAHRDIERLIVATLDLAEMNHQILEVQRARSATIPVFIADDGGKTH